MVWYIAKISYSMAERHLEVVTTLAADVILENKFGLKFYEICIGKSTNIRETTTYVYINEKKEFSVKNPETLKLLRPRKTLKSVLKLLDNFVESQHQRNLEKSEEYKKIILERQKQKLSF